MRISDWSSDVCSSDLSVGDNRHAELRRRLDAVEDRGELRHADARDDAGGADRARADANLDAVGARVDQRLGRVAGRDIAREHLHPVRQFLDAFDRLADARSEEHTSELQSLMRISYAVFCLKKKKTQYQNTI